jgi:N-acyl-D-aspartate/D-glutamate deacylase
MRRRSCRSAIAAVQVDIRGSAAREVDAYGLALAPGSIDVHSHDDFAVLLQPEMPFKVLQGVTTDIVGNCGSGVVPFAAGLESFRRLHPDADPEPWDGFTEYMERVEEAHPALNVAVSRFRPVTGRGCGHLSGSGPAAARYHSRFVGGVEVAHDGR